MYKKMMLVLVAVLTLSAAQFAAASEDAPYFTWNVASGNWDQVSNWGYVATPGGAVQPVASLPTINDGVEIDVSNYVATVADGMTAYAKYIALSNDSVDFGTAATNCTLNVTGGSLNVGSGGIWVGNGSGAVTNYLNISGGEVNIIGGDVEASYNGTAYVTMTGGVFNTPVFYLAYHRNGDFGYLQMDGGTLNIGAGGLQVRQYSGDPSTNTSRGYIDVTNGTIVISGDATARMAELQTAGQLTAFGGAGTLNVVYADGFTTITAVPEPITMLMLGLGGIAALRRRK